VQTHNDHQFHHYTHFHEAKVKSSTTNARGRGRFFEAESEDKILASRPACPRGHNVTADYSTPTTLLINTVMSCTLTTDSSWQHHTSNNNVQRFNADILHITFPPGSNIWPLATNGIVFSQ